MADKQIEDRVFEADNGGAKFKLPYVLTPAVELQEDKEIPTLTQKSEGDLDKHFERLKGSQLNTGGVGIIFGTYDNLHVGHRTMLRTAASLCDELYVGIESQSAALSRKNNKHPILDDAERIKMVEDFGITTRDKIFIRKNALDEIKALEASGKTISTMIVGESQKDNPEIVQAVEYCLSKGVQVVATTRVNVLNGKREISSSALHRSGHAKVSPPKNINNGGPK